MTREQPSTTKPESTGKQNNKLRLVAGATLATLAVLAMTGEKADATPKTRAIGQAEATEYGKISRTLELKRFGKGAVKAKCVVDQEFKLTSFNSLSVLMHVEDRRDSDGDGDTEWTTNSNFPQPYAVNDTHPDPFSARTVLKASFGPNLTKHAGKLPTKVVCIGGDASPLYPQLGEPPVEPTPRTVGAEVPDEFPDSISLRVLPPRQQK